MTQILQGVDYRTFRSLLKEGDRDTVEDLRVEMTRGVPVSTEEIESALKRLSDATYVEEYESGRWRVAANGLGVKGTLLGERWQDDDPPTCAICGALITRERGGELVPRPGGDMAWVHPACRGRTPTPPADT